MHYRCLGLLGVCSLLCGCFLVNAPSPPPPPVTEVSVTPGHLVFAPTPVGSQSPAQQLIVTNHTAVSVSFHSVFVMDHPHDYIVNARDCHPHLAPGASCTVSVIFRPRSTGDLYAQLHLPNRSATWTFIRDLAGTGIAATP
jgi:hypothetical protein